MKEEEIKEQEESGIFISEKTKYITSFFEKTSKKKIENYCLTRLWHRLDNDEIKIIPQQYVNINPEKYALTDVYLPQFKIHIEVNEPAHYLSQVKIEEDKLRKLEIENQTGHKLYTIDCRKELSQIHKQIDTIVSEINDRISEQKSNGTFKPWQPDIEKNPDYWKQKKVISLEDEISLTNIEDICKLFNADFNKTKRGFRRLGALVHPKNSNYLLWWPAERARQGWHNKLSHDEFAITETHEDEDKRKKHFHDHYNTRQIRIVFFHNKDILGLTSYKFKGLYSYDYEQSKPEIGTVWKRISDSMNIQLEDD